VPEAGKYECILYSKTRVRLDKVTRQETKFWEEVYTERVGEDRDGRPLRSKDVDDSDAKKYFGKGKKQAFFRRYKVSTQSCPLPYTAAWILALKEEM
jgi:hypothetical protein